MYSTLYQKTDTETLGVPIVKYLKSCLCKVTSILEFVLLKTSRKALTLRDANYAKATKIVSDLKKPIINQRMF